MRACEPRERSLVLFSEECIYALFLDNGRSVTHISVDFALDASVKVTFHISNAITAWDKLESVGYVYSAKSAVRIRIENPWIVLIDNRVLTCRS